MVYVGLLSVLAITCTSVVARPSDLDFKTKRSVEEDSGEAFNPPVIKFPTEIREGFKITINGTIDTTNNPFEAVFPSSSNNEEDFCKIIFDFKQKKIDVSPWPEDRHTYDYEPIGDNWENPKEHPTFSLTVTGTNHMFRLTFEANGGGPSPMMNCKIGKFEDFTHIKFRTGVHSVTSVLFEL